MDYTPEQYDAIHTHDCNLIVTAGAGSGKTRVLVDRFVALLDSHPDWSLPSLVAITFTEKAAREMRDRVRQTIEQRIEQATARDDGAAIERWRAHEAALDGARIGTIHSLCASILRANAAEIGIDPGFEVLDETEAGILLNDAIDQALAQAAEQDHGAARLVAEYGTVKVRAALHDLIHLPEDSWPKSQSYLEQWQTAYADNAQQVLDDLRQDTEFVAALAWDAASRCTDPEDKLMQPWRLVLDRLEALSPDKPLPAALDALTVWRDGIKLKGGKASAWGDKETVEAAKRYLELIRDRAKNTLDAIGPWDEADEKAAELLPVWGEAAVEAKSVYHSIKLNQRVLDFTDLELLTRDLLKDPDGVAARYRGREFQHILVDEFQDTNGAQRDIIYALAGLDRPGSLFVVGDPRQSIYRFRGADVSVFDQVRGDILSRGGREIELGTSFRTHARLVDDFNTIFARLMRRGEGQTAPYEVELGQPMTAVRDAEKHHSPYMEMILIDNTRAEPGRHYADDLRRWEAWTLAQRLRQMVESGWPAWDKQVGLYRPLHYGDMAVLFQASRSMALVEEVFKATGVPYVTVAGKGYYDRPEVRDLLSLLQALYNPFDDLALASTLRSPLFGLSDDDLFALRLQREPVGTDIGEENGERTGTQSRHRARLPLWIALTQDDRVYEPPLPDLETVAFARQALAQLRHLAGRVTIAELLTRALDETAYLATLSGLPDGARRCRNVDKLVEVARRSKRLALGEFTAYLQDLSEREAREGEALVEAEGAVHLMTVHASKGLEFPVVALFDASWERGGDDPTLVADPVVGPVCCVVDDGGKTVKPFAYRLARRYDDARDRAERTRLLYVGMTRAQDYVIVSGQSNGKGPWLRQLREALDLRDLPAAPGEEVIRGDCRLRVPAEQPDDDQYAAPAESPAAPAPAWDRLDQPGGIVPDAAAWQPSLLASVPVDRQAPARVLHASDIAVLGQAQAAGDPSLFRHYVLRDAPDTVPTVAAGEAATGVTRRIIGEMVHQALRWWHLPGNTPDLHNVLDSYAWEQGLTDPQMIEEAITRAADLLARTENSALFRRMSQASQVYRELPFTFRLGERTISGVIDVLFFSKYQRWTVVDYKTSFVGPEYGDQFPERIAAHAARYHAQLGIYAAAVEALTGQTPDVYLHYVRYVHTLPVAAETWKAVLQSLDADIAAALAE